MRDGGRWLEHRVSPEEAGRTVLEIAREEMGISGRMIQRLTRSRGLLLNRRPAFLRRSVRAGDVVAVRVVAEETPTLAPVAMPLSVLHEDADVLVLDKPPGILVHPNSPRQRATLAHGVAHRYAAAGVAARIRPVHRLDRDTSGAVLFARSAFAHQHLDRQLREGALTREYLALVEGEVEKEEGTIDAPIGRHQTSPALRAVRPHGRAARTHYAVVERLRGATLLRLRLETGRTHQIRVHLAHLGHPVSGDLAYGATRDIPGLSRSALHSSAVRFRHPRSGADLRVEAPLAADLQAVVEALR